jgi:hypothetical protein
LGFIHLATAIPTLWWNLEINPIRVLKTQNGVAISCFGIASPIFTWLQVAIE